jgi:hypothetical protein
MAAINVTCLRLEDITPASGKMPIFWVGGQRVEFYRHFGGAILKLRKILPEHMETEHGGINQDVDIQREVDGGTNRYHRV